MPFVSASRPLAVLAAALVLLPAASAQSADAFWSDVPEAAMRAAGPRTSTPAAYRTLRMDREAMAARLATAPLESLGFAGAVDVPVPAPDGSVLWFRVVESSIMAPALQAKYPGIRTYVGQGRDVPSATVRLSLTPAGFAAMARMPEGTVYVDPYAVGNADDYIAYGSGDVVLTDEQRAAIAAERLEDANAGDPGAVAPTTSNGATLRTYRLALSATVEYSTFHGGTVAGALAAQVTAMNRVNQVYENELSVRMEIVANNDTLVFVGLPASDPFTNSDGPTLLGENQALITARIGTANFDIGHVFSTGGGGVAGLGVVCNAGNKARGVTGLPQPTGDAFYIDYVAHEMGHQFRGNHSFNGNQGSCSGGNRNGSTAFEPGSGSTIMAYAGICGSNDIQSFSDPYFHAVSLQEIVGFISTGGGSTCGATAPTNNDIPIVTVPAGFVIPVRTPFVLTGSAVDATPASLTYAWEDFNLGAAGAPANNGIPVGPPYFRSFNPTPSPVRYFPQLSRQLAGLAPVRGEGLPIDARVLTFRLTARDNRAGGGAIGDANIFIATDAGAGPFAVTAPNTAGLTFARLSTQTVTWSVANTDLLDDGGLPDADGVDVESVEIRYSTDGGTTFSTLVASTPNDGSEDVRIPDVETTRGRLLIQAVGNNFFDVNNANFTVTGVVANETRAADAAGLSAVAPNPATETATFTLRSGSTQAVTVAVYDALGRRVALLHDGPVGAEQAFSVDVSRLPAGLYVVRASGSAVQSTQRFTVVR